MFNPDGAPRKSEKISKADDEKSLERVIDEIELKKAIEKFQNG